jgi:hypothetical protein
LSFWIQHPDLLLRMLLQIVVTAGLLLILARSLCRRARRESPAFAARYDRVAGFLALAWSGAWRGAALVLGVGAVIATTRLLFCVPTHFLQEVAHNWAYVLVAPLSGFVRDRFFLWDVQSRLMVYATALPGILGAGFVLGAAFRLMFHRSRRGRVGYRVAMAAATLLVYHSLCVHRPWRPAPYHEEGEWITHSNRFFSIRVPAAWTHEDWVQAQYAVTHLTNQTGIAVASVSAGDIDRGPEHQACLCAPLSDYHYARHGRTHVWVLKDDQGRGLKISNPTLAGGCHHIRYSKTGLSARAVDHILDSFRFLEPPAEPRP